MVEMQVKNTCIGVCGLESGLVSIGWNSNIGGSGYRYGFNGKENDNEVKGEGNQQDYGERAYDPRLGRWMSPDPHLENYPFYSTYAAFNNNPNYYADDEGRDAIAKIVTDKNGNKTLVITATYHYIKGQVSENVLKLVKKEFKRNGDQSGITYQGEKISVKFQINFVEHPVDQKDAKPSYYNKATGENDMFFDDFSSLVGLEKNGDLSDYRKVVVSTSPYNRTAPLSNNTVSRVPQDVADNEVANFIVHGIGHNIGFVHGTNGEGVMDRIVGDYEVTEEIERKGGVPTGNKIASWNYNWDKISKKNVQTLVDRIDNMTKNQGKGYWNGKSETNLQGNAQTNLNYGKEESIQLSGTTVKVPNFSSLFLF